MTTSVCACGIYSCDTCDYLNSSLCPGCKLGNMRLGEEGHNKCAVFSCVESHGLDSCNDCRTPSCKLIRSVESICPLRGKHEKKRWWAGKMSRAFENRRQSKADAAGEDAISEKVISRLRWYFIALDQFASEGMQSISSWQLAEKVGVNSALIRKDLSRFGEFGTPSFGYRIDYLTEKIKRILKLDKPRQMVWIGGCMFRNISRALDRLAKHEYRVVGVFDIFESEIGLEAYGLTIQSLDKIGQSDIDLDTAIAVIAVPGPMAQSVASVVAKSGIKGILNLSGELLTLPDDVKVSSLDIVGELIELAYYCG